ncbi:hypothetical protein F5B20DRAFT_563014 [Whalleya microplaca]|nr:hypothetical protein F5B20DRAFT_563014 [Whalleya microplaca]
MSTNDFSGWAIRRNGSCLLSQEVDCGATAAPFRACCPSSTVCPSQYNVACCQSGTNCTATFVETPRCANESWIMFDNGGHFCCEQNQVGYKRSNTDGCSKSGASLPNGAMPLAVLDQVSQSSTTSSTVISTPTSSTTSAPTTESDSSNTNNAGAIAGGVIGGIAFIAIIFAGVWFIRRRRNQSGEDIAHRDLPYATNNEKDASTVVPDRTEIDGNPRSELSNEPPITTHELP